MRGQAVLQAPVLLQQFQIFQGAIDQESKVVDFDGFGDEVEGSQFHGLHRGVDVAVSGQQDALGVGEVVADFFQKIHAAQTRHAQVENH